MARLLKIAASLWVTLIAILAAALLLAASRFLEREVGVWIAGPFALLFFNLAAALAVNERMRAKPGLLVFHIGLAVLALLAAWGRLSLFDGRVEVSEGQSFDPALAIVRETGPLHRNRLGEVDFIQQDFSVDYAPGMKRRHTVSRVAVPSERGKRMTVTVGDDVPLIVAGYRFYTSANRGFAPLIAFTGPRGETVAGLVHMPSYPINEDNQGETWRIPGSGRQIALWLHLPTPVFDEGRAWSFTKPADARLVVIDGATRTELALGEETDLPEGRLAYLELRSWMGYVINSDPSLPWLAAAALVAAGGIVWHALVDVAGGGAGGGQGDGRHAA
jgi:hypothetical protein